MKRFAVILCSVSVCLLTLPGVVAAEGPNSRGNNTAAPPNQTAGSGAACRIDFGVTPDDGGGSLGPFTYGAGTPLDWQFQYTQRIVFGAAVDSGRPPTVLTTDSACPQPDGSDNVSSGFPEFATDWWCQFMEGIGGPGPAHVESFSADVCYVNNPGIVAMEAYNNDKRLIASAVAPAFGCNRLTVVAPPGEEIGYVRVASSLDVAGLSVDCLDYTLPKSKLPAVSTWGMVVVTALLLAGLAIKFARRQAKAVVG